MQVQRVGSANAAIAAEVILLDMRAKLYASWPRTAVRSRRMRPTTPSRPTRPIPPGPRSRSGPGGGATSAVRSGDNGAMADGPSIRPALARRFDPDELRRSRGCGSATRSPRMPATSTGCSRR